ncbi:MAG: hypothetical protein CMH54_01775 [Myxococcales bacterium]|nr:hypothetical protein [Myxococcales bacterium]
MTQTQLTPAITVQTPAKAILAGEHLVLHGASAIAVPVWERSLTLRLALRSGDRLVLPEPLTSCSESVHALLEGQVTGFVRTWITSDIPMGAGLGSSAALSVALGRALVLARTTTITNTPVRGTLEPDDEALARRIAQEIEASIHGKASGIDTAVVAYGSPVRLEPEGEGPPSIHPLTVTSPQTFLLLDTGLRRATSEQIRRVATSSQQGDFTGLMEQGRLHTDDLIEGLATGDNEQIFEAVQDLGHVLQNLGVEPAAAAPLRERATAAGLALKVTGAGGGGFLLAYSPMVDDLKEFAESFPLQKRILFTVPAQTSATIRVRSHG